MSQKDVALHEEATSLYLLGMMLDVGVPVFDTLGAVADFIFSHGLRLAYQEMQDQVQKGANLRKSMIGLEGNFSPFVPDLVEVGDKTNSQAWTLMQGGKMIDRMARLVQAKVEDKYIAPANFYRMLGILLNLAQSLPEALQRLAGTDYLPKNMLAAVVAAVRVNRKLSDILCSFDVSGIELGYIRLGEETHNMAAICESLAQTLEQQLFLASAGYFPPPVKQEVLHLVAEYEMLWRLLDSGSSIAESLERMQYLGFNRPMYKALAETFAAEHKLYKAMEQFSGPFPSYVQQIIKAAEETDATEPEITVAIALGKVVSFCKWYTLGIEIPTANAD